MTKNYYFLHICLHAICYYYWAIYFQVIGVMKKGYSSTSVQFREYNVCISIWTKKLNYISIKYLFYFHLIKSSVNHQIDTNSNYL